MKCKFLRQLESKGEKTSTVDKTRAKVKDLHSRIIISIHRINSISKRIAELRDKELQPQLEELIEGYTPISLAILLSNYFMPMCIALIIVHNIQECDKRCIKKCNQKIP